jgi:predicted acylesterase/phospholipase RssA
MGRDCMFAADLTGHTSPTLFLFGLQALGSAAAVSRRLMNDTGGIRDPQPTIALALGAGGARGLAH